MLTNNFKKILFKYIFGFSANSTGGDPPTNYSNRPTLISTSGSSLYMTDNGYGSGSIGMWFSAVNSLSTVNTTPTNGRGYIILGSGTTEPTPEDYCLESQITENLSCDSVSVSRNTTIKTYTATFSNSGTSPMTVTEIGYVSRTSYAYNAGENSFDNFLMDRTVLDTPVTIPAGESRTITYTLSF